MDSYPTPPEPERRPGDPGPAPSSVRTAVTLIWVGAALGLLSTVLGFLELDSRIDEAAADMGTTDVEVDRAVLQGGVVFGILTGAAVSIGLAFLFAYFIGKGAGWARIVYTVLGAAGLLFSLPVIADQRGVDLLLSVVGTAITIAVVVLLFRPASNAYFRGA